MPDREHWNALYGSREETALTWFEEEAALSRQLVARYATPGQPIVDVGGGASRLVDGLLKDGFGPLTVLDLSDTALSLAKARLGARATEIDWIEGDVLDWAPERTYSVWHDRAVLHFLTEPERRDAYFNVMANALQPGGHAILATFDLDGPEKCAGLPVARYSPDSLRDALAVILPDAFEPVTSQRHLHETPLGKKQEFQVSVFRRLSPSGL
ncbi:class I SAM-dependent methyltransferase [Aliiruegeria lutimaris]|uniref:Methyltransferase domain-containing protein n=1 Tax=Aliiruegeria lutimaris TaxID=571298 RepID=A0A1G8Q804_9RHOB|nr:class I SAM-dependent methyltransferase [Aliiruegeria lutimaris]SDJ00894.1 Methyltransferase domain-containing protein [Aliiruegeria lutimaris]